MEVSKNKTYQIPNIFWWMRILQYTSRLFGVNFSKHGFGLNVDSLFMVVAFIWYSGCFLGMKLCRGECSQKATNKNLVVIMSGLRIVHFGLLVCIVKVGFSSRQVERMLHLNNQSKENIHGYISFKYHRRTFVIVTLFLAWILGKVIQLKDSAIDARENEKLLGTLNYACAYSLSCPLMILNWQFLMWMQVFSHASTLSFNRLKRAVISSQEIPIMKHKLQMIESISRIKVVLELKEQILDIYGLSVVFGQIRASLWIVLNAYWYSNKSRNAWITFLVCMLVLNIFTSFLPHWVGQEISSEVSLSRVYASTKALLSG